MCFVVGALELGAIAYSGGAILSCADHDGGKGWPLHPIVAVMLSEISWRSNIIFWGYENGTRSVVYRDPILCVV
jgi:hypothetical protein